MQFTFDKVTVRHNNHSTVITSYNLDVTEKRQSGGSVTFSNVSRPYKNTASGCNSCICAADKQRRLLFNTLLSLSILYGMVWYSRV